MIICNCYILLETIWERGKFCQKACLMSPTELNRSDLAIMSAYMQIHTRADILLSPPKKNAAVYVIC